MGKKDNSRFYKTARRSMLFFTAAMLFCFLACGKKPFENPLDPDDDDYVKPRIVYLSLLDSTLLTTDTLTVSWQANYPAFCEYAYRFQTDEAWSGWISDTALLDLVAHGDYTFQISVRYRGKVDTTMTSAFFSVNTLTSPAVYLYPLKQTVTAAAPNTSFTLRCTGLDTCNAMEIVVRGVTINSASLVDSTATNSFVLKCDSIITVCIGPADMPVCNTMPFLSINVTPITSDDTTQVVMYVPSARFVNDSTQHVVPVNQAKGGCIVKK